MPSSWKASIDATADAHASGWPEYVSPPAKNREPAGEVAAAELLGDRLRDDHRPERDVARVDPLRDREDVGDDVPVLDAEPLARASEAGHYFVGDQKNAVLVAQIA